MLSAFWHGFYPAYYNTFFFSAFIVEIAKDVYRQRDLFTWIPWPIRAVCLYFLSMGALNYLAVGLVLLEFEKAFYFYKSYYFFGQIAIIGTFIVFRFVIPKPKKKQE